MRFNRFKVMLAWILTVCYIIAGVIIICVIYEMCDPVYSMGDRVSHIPGCFLHSTHLSNNHISHEGGGGMSALILFNPEWKWYNCWLQPSRQKYKTYVYACLPYPITANLCGSIQLTKDSLVQPKDG